MKFVAALCLLITFGFVLSTQNYQKDGVKHHNEYRSKHQSQPLQMDPNLNKVAEKCAAYYISGRPEHSCPGANKYGENIFEGSSSVGPPSFSTTCSEGITDWYCESDTYDYVNPDKSKEEYRHFTQLVWRGSKKLGLGCASSTPTKSTCCVAIYSPPGNVKGEYQKNVLKSIQNDSSVDDCPNSK